MRKVLAVLFTFLAGTASAVSPVTLDQQSAKNDLQLLSAHVQDLARFAREHIEDVGLAAALKEFVDQPWKRSANGLHLWGVTTSGISWFDAGHPELVGLDVSAMSDLEGRLWAQMAVASATGSGEAQFQLLFPHPITSRAAKGLHSCFMLADGQRVLCAGAFLDPA